MSSSCPSVFNHHPLTKAIYSLDSRQRKKQHTERLEEEKKNYSSVVNDFEDALQDCKAREEEWLREKGMMMETQQQYFAHIDNLRLQQEEMVRHHTIETGELRRKNAMFVEQLQRFEAAEMSNVTSPHGISSEYSEFDQMNLGPWDNTLTMGHDFTIDNSHTTPIQQQEQAVKQPIQESEKPAASAFLLMLLLCGAWVASRTNPSSSNILPAIPDEMRVASANVLDNLYKDSGVQLEGISSVSKMSAIHPTSAKTVVLSAIEPSAGAFSSNLDNLHHHLTTPTHQQLKDQAYSLTPSQYYEMTSVDARYQQAYYDHHHHHHQQQEQQQQRNSRMMTEAGPVYQENPNTADTYIRSLLRDKVSTQILKDFAKMVAQSNLESPPAIWKTESMS